MGEPHARIPRASRLLQRLSARLRGARRVASPPQSRLAYQRVSVTRPILTSADPRLSVAGSGPRPRRVQAWTPGAWERAGRSRGRPLDGLVARCALIRSEIHSQAPLTLSRPGCWSPGITTPQALLRGSR